MPATVTGKPGFAVQGTHAYSAAGAYTVKVTVQDSQPDRVSSSPITIESTVEASSSGVLSLSGYEGEPLSGVIAQFCEPPSTPKGASVEWGDGTPVDTATTITGPSANDCYQVSASHTYAEESSTPYTVKVTLDLSSGGTLEATGTAQISDAPLSATIDAEALSGSSLTIPESVIAHVTDANTDAPPCNTGGPCDLSAQIAWGDGASSAGTISHDPSGGYNVSAGPHTFPGPGTYTVSVTVTDKGGSTAHVSGSYTVKPPPALRQGCQSPVPAAGAIAGLYGSRLDESTYKPDFGISPDDRVLRFGNLVLCAEENPWTYQGSAPFEHACLVGCFQGGSFQTKGKLLVNGIQLDPPTLAPFTVDTWSDSISGPYSLVSPTSASGFLGTADLTAEPWILSGDSLAYMPASYTAEYSGLKLAGDLHIRIDGLGTSAVEANALMPDVFSLQAYSGGQPTSAIAIHDAYPGSGTDPGAGGATAARAAPLVAAHAADDECSYPASSAPIQLTAPNLYLGGVEMQCAYLDYDPSSGDATGGGGFGLGPAYVHGFLELEHNAFKGAGGSVTLHPGVAIAPLDAVTLEGIDFSVLLNPTVLDAQATLGIAGGLASLEGGALTAFATDEHPYGYNWDKPLTGHDDIPGTETVLYGRPFTSFTIGAGGSFDPLGLPLTVHGYALYVYPAYIEFGGAFSASLLGNAISLNANLQGQFWINERAFNIEGGANLCLPNPIGCNSIDGILSSRGLIGCFNVNVNLLVEEFTISMGGGYKWGESWPSIYLTGCSDNFGSYRVTGAASVAQATGARTYLLPKGLPGAMLRISGAGDAPAFTITGPHGERATAGADGRFSGSRRIVILRMPQFHATWVGIEHPAGGRWTITPLPGAAPIASVAVADGVPPASVHAHVSGSGYRRTLRYTIRRRPGQTVQFAETGAGASQSLATTGAAHGTLRFTPAIGPAGRRQILALVYMEGVPTKRLIVASYLAPGPPRAQRPRDLRLARRGSALRMSWRAGANTTRFEIVLIATDGRRLLLQRPASARSATISGFAASGATVKLLGIGPDGNAGATAVAHLPKLPAPARILRLKATRSPTQVHLSWRPAPRALLYRVTLTLSGSHTPFDLLSTHPALSFTLAGARTEVHVTVQGQGALGVLGPKTSLRLAPAPPARRRTG